MSRCEIRWMFNALTWNPTKDQLNTAMSSISVEEQLRIQKFYFRGDYKLGLIGRLMIRRCVNLVLGIPWKDIVLARSDKGKPVLNNRTDAMFSFNISHHGNYTILAASTCAQIGVDVMKYAYPNNADVPSYFKLMNRQFAAQEWDYIRSFESELRQLKAFIRLWCLKESYVKAIGTGIGTDSAASIRFLPKTRDMYKHCGDSEIFVKDTHEPNWKFEESAIDGEHVVSVARNCNNNVSSEIVEFETVTYQSLLEGHQALTSVDESWWNDFLNKGEKT